MNILNYIFMSIYYLSSKKTLQKHYKTLLYKHYKNIAKNKNNFLDRIHFDSFDLMEVWSKKM